MEHHKTMTAEIKPDLYGGENCDEMRPEWHCQVEGDMGDDMNLQILTLDCSTFPPGTLVDVKQVTGAVIHHGLSSIVVTVRLGFPILVAITFGHATLGVIGRFAPQMSMQSMGLSFAILSGGYALFHVVPMAAYAASEFSVQALHQMQ